MRQGVLILAVGRVRSKFEVKKTKKKTRKNPAAPKTHREINPQQPGDRDHLETACTVKHVSRVSPYSPASIDTGFVEIGILQLSQSVKTTNLMSHARTQRQTNKIMAPCTHPGMNRLFCLKAKNSLITRREVIEARRPHTCSRPCEFEGKKIRKTKNHKKSAPPKTHHESQSSPVAATTSRRHVMKHVPRVRQRSLASIEREFVEISLVQLSRSVKTTNVTHTLTDTDTD